MSVQEAFMSASHTTVSHIPDSPGINLFPPVIFFTCLLVGIGLELWLPWSVSLLPQPAGLCAGMAVALAGFAFMGWGHRKFKKLGLNVKTNLPAGTLVTNEAFRYSRNPMYVGVVSILAGLGLAAGSLPMLLSAIPMFLYLDWYVIRREEKYLRRRFGIEYEIYCRNVRRWL
jgi:protein-S-isoprenylcysteine O-methyltransferase Ste14